MKLASATRLLVPALLVAACGDLYADPVVDHTTISSDGPNAPNAAFDASASIPQDFIQQCSSVAPVEGGRCNLPGLTCEYGSSPDMRCNTTLACVPDESFSGSWEARPSVLCPTYQCPTGGSAALEGTPCGLPSADASTPADADELVCPVDDGICACTTGTDAAHAHARRWVCVKPVGNCPLTRPLAGQSCANEGTCDYGSCAFKRGVRMECSVGIDQVNGVRIGVWMTGSAVCAN